jgi:hypothetical protein
MRYAFAFLLCGAAYGALLAGAAKNVITPDLKTYGPVYMAGFGTNRAATGVHDELWARCVALRAGNRPLVVCAVDLIGLFFDDTNRIRAAIREQVANADVVVAATHVHEGPDTMGQWGASPAASGINDAYMAFLTAQVTKTALAAIANLEPARVTLATVKDPRLDAYIDDGRPPVKHDAELILLALANAAGKPIATVVNWADHPETLGSKNTELSADYPYYLLARIEAKRGGMAVLWNGAVGGMQSPLGAKVADPRTNAEAKDGTFRKAEIIGESVADLACDGIAKGSTVEIDRLEFRETQAQIPMTNQGFQMAAKAGIFKGRKLPNADGTTNVPVGFIRATAKGKPVLEAALIPGEMYPELSVGGVERYSEADYPDAPIEPAIKGLMTAPYRMLVGLANDENGYIIPKAEWDEKAPYLDGAKRKHYGEVNSLGPETAPRIADRFRQLVRP